MVEAVSFTPSALLDLFILDGTAIGMSSIFYFCDGTNANFQPIIFNSLSYTPFPIKLSDFGLDGKGSLPRPKLTVSNINGFVSALLLQNQQLVGATLTRRRVFARFIDSTNWPTNQAPLWSTPDSSAAYPDEPFLVNRKITENPQIVQWELSSPLELQNAQLPRQQIIGNVCTWKYRQTGTCNYSGLPISDAANRLFGAGGYGFTLVDQGLYNASTTYNIGDCAYIVSSIPQFNGIKIYYVCQKNGTVGITPNGNPSNWIVDQCAKSCASCKLRFPTEPLRGSFYPGTSRSGWVVSR